jgi:hypothetical protein
MHVYYSFVILFLLMETTFEMKLVGLWQNVFLEVYFSTMHVYYSFVILFLLMETTFETKLVGLWQNGIHPFFI